MSNIQTVSEGMQSWKLYQVGHVLNLFEQWLTRVLYAIGASRLLFITIDEFEEIGLRISDGRIQRETLRKLRGILQDPRFDQLAIMFSGANEIDKLMPPEPGGINMSPFANATTFPLQFLTREETRSLIIEPIKDFPNMPVYEPDAVEEIIRLTQGQPYYVQLLGSAIFEAVNSQR